MALLSKSILLESVILLFRLLWQVKKSSLLWRCGCGVLYCGRACGRRGRRPGTRPRWRRGWNTPVKSLAKSRSLTGKTPSSLHSCSLHCNRELTFTFRYWYSQQVHGIHTADRYVVIIFIISRTLCYHRSCSVYTSIYNSCFILSVDH